MHILDYQFAQGDLVGLRHGARGVPVSGAQIPIPIMVRTHTLP